MITDSEHSVVLKEISVPLWDHDRCVSLSLYLSLSLSSASSSPCLCLCPYLLVSHIMSPHHYHKMQNKQRSRCGTMTGARLCLCTCICICLCICLLFYQIVSQHAVHQILKAKVLFWDYDRCMSLYLYLSLSFGLSDQVSPSL